MTASDAPTFSIVMPTRNRAFIIEHALKSALAQTDPDFEVVVSDNHSKDDTAALVGRYAGDPRVKYARTERDLSMPDNWEAALSRARGRWVLVLEDDCVLAKDLLARARRALEAHPDVAMLTFGFWGYNSSAVEPAGSRNQFVTEPFSGEVELRYARDTLRSLFALRVGHPMPRLYNTVVRRDLVDAVKERLGRFFLTPAPDYTAGTALLALSKRYVHIDAPLMMSNTGATSPHSSPTTFATFQKELEGGNRGGYTPIQLPYVSTCNIIPESICKVKSLLPDELRDFALEPETYLPYFLIETVRFEEEGWKLPTEWQALRSFYEALPVEHKARAGATMARAFARHRARGTVRQAAYKLAPLRKALERVAGRTVVRGDEQGFSDLSGAMAHLERTLLAQTTP